MAKARNKRGRRGRALLVIAPWVPDFDRVAGSRRFFAMLRILSSEYRVLFLGGVRHGGEAGERYVSALTSLGIEFYDSASTHVEALLPQVEVGVFFEFYTAAEKTLDVVRLLRGDLPIVVDSVDLHFVRERRALDYAQEPQIAQRRALETRRRELRVYRRADVVIVVTESDKATLLGHLPESNVAVVPTIHEARTTVPDFHARTPNSLLFVGGFEHSPNVDAVLFFCREVLPLLRQSVPYVTLTIVGDSAPKEIRALASATIVVTGWVPDVRPYLDSHVVSIAPLRFGSGMKGKVGEAMAHGLPAVVTSIAAEGMELVDGVTALIADSAKDFANAVDRLLGDDALHARLSANGRHAVRTRWSEAVVAERLLLVIRTLSELTPKRPPLRTQLLRIRFLARKAGAGRLLRRVRLLLHAPRSENGH